MHLASCIHTRRIRPYASPSLTVAVVALLTSASIPATSRAQADYGATDGVQTELGPATTLIYADVLHGDFVVAGTSIRTLLPGGSQTEPLQIAISGIPASSTVVRAYLNWVYNTNIPGRAEERQVFLNGTEVNGALSGVSIGDLRWGKSNTAAYTTDVTQIVQATGGNGTYSLTSILDRPDLQNYGDGVTLIVVYENSEQPLRAVNIWSGLTFECFDTTAPEYINIAQARLQFRDANAVPLAYTGGQAHFMINGQDGQYGNDTFRIEHVVADGFPGTVSADPPDAWQGLIGPGAPGGGKFFDIAEGDVSGYLEPFDWILDVETEAINDYQNGDCLAHSMAAIAFEYRDPCDPVVPAGTFDCDDDGVSDFCEIRDGTSCDTDWNGVPDECSACCDSGACENRLPENCLTPYVGAVCDGTYCTCSYGACCVEDTCGFFGTDCECRSEGGAKPGSICTETTCELGSCCLEDGSCIDGVTKLDCEYEFGEYTGGGNCARDALPCVRHRVCPEATIDQSACQPPSGVVDAGYPHSPTDASQLWGIGDFFSTRAEDKIRVRLLSPSGDPVTGAVDPRCWCLCETSGDPNGGPNYIAAIRELSGSVLSGGYEIVLGHAIAKGAVTTLSYVHDPNYISYISHPGNVDGNGFTNAQDILNLIDFLNSGNTQYAPWLIYSADVDRSGQYNSTDILGVIDLLNGAGQFDSWNDTPLPINTSCPGTCGLCSLGGGPMSATAPRVPSSPQVQSFNTQLVHLLQSYKPNESFPPPELGASLRALADWYFPRLSKAEQDQLRSALSSDSLQFASPEGRVAAATLLDLLPHDH